MIIVFFAIPHLNEIRKTEKFEGTRTLKNLILNETKPTLIEEAHQLMSIKKYLNEK
jgi:hypothetical protein